MAAGVPVLGWANGGNMDIVEHGVTGYLAAPGDLDDLANGLEYCVKFRKTLGRNSSHKALAWDWGKVANILAGVYELAIKRYAI
jgi:glycosyltransferase involved in cell wall biosynthesis